MQEVGDFRKRTMPHRWTQQEINKVATATVDPGSLIRTDGLSGFGKLSDIGFGHDIIQTNKLVPEECPFPEVHI